MLINYLMMAESSVVLCFNLSIILFFWIMFVVFLTAPDAVRLSLSGEYVVPATKDIMLHCSAPHLLDTISNSFRWNITLGDFVSNDTDLSNLPSDISHKFTMNKNLNPTILHVHNLQLNESGATIQCIHGTRRDGRDKIFSSVLHILVEG